MRRWFPGMLLAGQLLFPAAIFALGEFTETPTGATIDWAATSPKARANDVILYAHIAYALALVALLKGWRVQAVALGVLLVPVSAVAHFFTYFAVTGVYS